MTDPVPPRETPPARHPRRGRRAAAIALLLLLPSPWWAPPLLRRMEFFRVRHVEVRGARYTPASQIVARLDVDTTFSIWNDLAPLEARVREHPQVEAARIVRRFPGTLVVRLEERVPIALVPTATGLRAYDADGRSMPLDPSRTPVDLPVLARRDTALLRLLAEIRVHDPAFFARVSEARRAGRDELVLELVTVPVRVRPDVALDRLAQISSVERDLARRGVRAVELDLRFRDQVIARFQ